MTSEVDNLMTLDEAKKRIGLADSYARAEVLFTCMCAVMERRARLKLFVDHYCDCDAPWAYSSVFLSILRFCLEEVPLVDVLDAKSKAVFEALPDGVTIYRGCEAGRVRGLSWTTRREIAEGFAIGKRCRNKVPTLAEAIIPKAFILAVFTSRDEGEIVPDPRRLRRLKVTTIAAAAA